MNKYLYSIIELLKQNRKINNLFKISIKYVIFLLMMVKALDSKSNETHMFSCILANTKPMP